MKKILLLLLSILYPFVGYSAILFETNFDSNADWTVTQNVGSNCGYWAGVETGCSTGVTPPTNWDGWYMERGSCSSIGNNILYINSTAGYGAAGAGSVACYGGSGKCVTQWDEQCTSAFTNSDGQLYKDLGNEYQTLSIRYDFRFSPTYPFNLDSGEGWGKKAVHLQHYLSGSPWQYAVSGTANYGNQPTGVFGHSSYSGYLEETYGPRGYCGASTNETSANPPYYSCYSYDNGTPTNVWLTGGSSGDGSGLLSFDQQGAYQDYRTMYTASNIQTKFRDGNWHRYEAYAKLNTWNGSSWNADGVIKVWIDGVLYISRTNTVWMKCYNGICSPERGWRVVSIGGNSQTDNVVSNGEDWFAIDNFIIADAEIGTEYEIGGADTTAPTVTSVAISANGTTVTVTFDETVVTTGYDNGDFDLDCSSGGNNIALNSISGTGSTRTFTAAKTIYSGDTCNLDYTGGADEIEDAAGNDLAAFSNTAVTNNSTQVIQAIVGGGVTMSGVTFR